MESEKHLKKLYVFLSFSRFLGYCWASWALCWPMLESSSASLVHLGAMLGHVGAKISIKIDKMKRDRRQEEPREAFRRTSEQNARF